MYSCTVKGAALIQIGLVCWLFTTGQNVGISDSVRLDVEHQCKIVSRWGQVRNKSYLVAIYRPIACFRYINKKVNGLSVVCHWGAGSF